MNRDPDNLDMSPANFPATVAGRFVLLRHELPASHERDSHWDLMLEIGPTLRTWALPCELTPEHDACSDDRGPAIALADHRRAYLEYEGPVSGDRGFVVRCDQGTHTSTISVERTTWRVVLQGRRLHGELTLELGEVAKTCVWRWRPA